VPQIGRFASKKIDAADRPFCQQKKKRRKKTGGRGGMASTE
jgi:hypothetical protein